MNNKSLAFKENNSSQITIRGTSISYLLLIQCYAKFEKLTLPNEGEIITFNQGNPNVPNNPIVPFIRGDGTGVDIWPATQIFLDSAIKKSYGDKR